MPDVVEAVLHRAALVMDGVSDGVEEVREERAVPDAAESCGFACSESELHERVPHCGGPGRSARLTTNWSLKPTARRSWCNLPTLIIDSPRSRRRTCSSLTPTMSS